MCASTYWSIVGLDIVLGDPGTVVPLSMTVLEFTLWIPLVVKHGGLEIAPKKKWRFPKKSLISMVNFPAHHV